MKDYINKKINDESSNIKKHEKEKTKQLLVMLLSSYEEGHDQDNIDNDINNNDIDNADDINSLVFEETIQSQYRSDKNQSIEQHQKRTIITKNSKNSKNNVKPCISVPKVTPTDTINLKTKTQS